MLSKWYTKKEIALRYTILFCGVSPEHERRFYVVDRCSSLVSPDRT